MSEAPIFFGEPDSKTADTFGFLGAGHLEDGRAVILCPPLGYEAICTHQAYRALAARLAAEGMSTLRFDWHGTFDSAGSDRDPHRVAAWLSSARGAIAEMRRRGAKSIALVGLRLGATLALTAAARDGDIDAVVAWSPPAKGRALSREMRALSKLGEGGEGATEVDGIEVAGFFVASETLEEMSQLDLLALKSPPARRVLLIDRDDLPSNDKLEKHLAGLGGATTRRVLGGIAALLDEPLRSKVPEAIFAATIEHLAAMPKAKSKLEAASREDATTSFGVVREEAVRFGPAGRLFGVLSEAHGARQLGVILLNTGADPHVGPSRLYVPLAREWAAQGLTVLRFDLGGLGESAPPPGAPKGDPYPPHAIQDIRAAAELLRARGVTRVVLAGLCSGAYFAFHAALTDLQLAGLVLVNPQLYWRAGHSVEMVRQKPIYQQSFFKRSVMSAEGWRRVIRGELKPKHMLTVMRRRLETLASAQVVRVSARFGLGKASPERDIGRQLMKLVQGTTPLFLVFSEADIGLDYLDLHAARAMSLLRSGRRQAFAVVAGANHTFTQLPAQRRLLEQMRAYVGTLASPSTGATSGAFGEARV